MNSTRESFKKIRIEKSLTQKRLAEISDVTETTIRNIENKRVNPSFELAIRLSKILETNFEQLWDIDFQSK
ncbi:helix-turn-helix transcriptional regulator [Enterococcus faecium]|uniref:helix-turn-helix transcriptional regulator n=1 Tax=Enterococcus TaxID=1350 RepID=UPI00032F1EC5|nr:helix-turn-helix transcriptional regulator [Enterococcus faecium]EOL00987.1 cro/CI family transcriptional regulator [Enterococcus faecium EnGen0153]EOL63089.1 cro/CI family transcriptional regulator [Enterococcus faecium EnGen0305]QXJ65770.1 helix-turn-helix transcriptional regulator [Enterococcus faecium]